MLTGECGLGKAETSQKPTKFVGILDCYHFTRPRLVADFQAEQPEAERRGPPHGWPGLPFRRQQRPYRSVPGKQGGKPRFDGKPRPAGKPGGKPFAKRPKG